MTAYEIPGFKHTLLAGVDLRTSQFRFVDVNNAGRAVLPTVNGRAIAVIQNKPNTGEACELMFTGISKVVASAPITAGANVTTGADGRVATAAAGNRVVGIALEAAATAGDYLPILISPAYQTVSP